MSIKSFHIFFISISSLLGAGMLAWGLRYREVDGNALLVLITGTLLLVALIPYFFWFLKKLRTASLSVALLILSSLYSNAEACSTCFGDPNSLNSKGIVWGVLFLGVVIVSLLVTMIAITLQWSKRSKNLPSS